MGFLCFPNGHDIQLFIYRSNQESGNLKQDFDAMLYCIPILSRHVAKSKNPGGGGGGGEGGKGAGPPGRGGGGGGEG